MAYRFAVLETLKKLYRCSGVVFQLVQCRKFWTPHIQ